MLIRLLIVWLISQILVYLFEAKVNLRHSQSNKHFISQLDEGSFEIVHPFQVRDKKERIGIDTHNYFLNATSHYKSVVIVIPSKSVIESRLKLVLSINDYLFLNETQFKKLDENGESSVDSHFENCYYQGFVNGDPSSFVAISTCNGLWGVIAFENGTTLGLWPLDGGDRSRRHPHVLYKTRWIRDAACGAITQTSAEFLPLRSSMDAATSALMKIKRDINRQMKYLEMAVVGDYNFIKEMNATDKEGIEYMLNVINIVDMVISRNLKIRVSVVYAEVWMDAQRIDLHSDIQRTLSGSLDYITGHIYHVEKDASIIFTGGFFANSESLSASFSSVCTARSVAIVKAIDSYAIHTTSQLVTHAIGHIIGIDHDSAECICQGNSLCIMNRQIGSIGSPFSWEFSKCSVARLHNVLQSEHFQCLLSRPFQTSRLHSCGNGVVDGDEECDCGRRDECQDSCCDPITCTLRAHARCASHQACCHQCELRFNGHICRESNSVCDVPEMCDGLNGDCPIDGYFIDGVSCGINGHCWKGKCSDSEQQCKELWGFSAKLADDLCFDSNQKGVEYGNCGSNRNGEYLSCSAENGKCGTLHCKDGSATPQPSTLMSFNLQFVHNNRQIQCKAIIGSESMVALVKDGTHCAPGKVCIENACVPLTQVSAPIYCPSNNLALQCSGHGDCTTTSKCLCYDGWAGVSCDIRSNVSRRLIFSTNLPSNTNDIFPSFKVGRALDTATLFGILLVVGIFLILILVCLLFCYRRQSSAELHRANTMRDKVEDETEDNSCRAIKFGQMPSYREEKRKRKKNKLVYDALQRINEAAEERDTPSLKSRDSSVINSIQQTNCGDSVKNHINGSVKMMESRHNSNSNLLQINKQQQPPQRQQIFRSTDCINNLGQLSIANGLLSEKRHPQQSFRCDDNLYYSDSLKKYSNSNSSQHNLYNNFTSQHINPQNIYVDSIYHDNLNNLQLQNFQNNCGVLNGSGNNLNHLQNGIMLPTSNCYSPNRSDFCANNYNTLTGNTESLLRQNTLQKQQSFTSKTLNFSERNGYATDSEVVTSGFGSGSGSGSASLRFTAAGPLSERNGFSSPLSSVAGNSNRNSGENDVPHSLLSETECLNNSETPPPPLRLQSIQMLMKRLNSGNDDGELQHFNNLKGIACGQMCGSPSELNSFELNDMFINRAPTIEERLDNEYELTSSNIAAYHRHHQLNNKAMGGNGPLGITRLPEPPPASADSGHPGSNYDIQDSPSLFLDPFKLDLSN